MARLAGALLVLLPLLAGCAHRPARVATFDPDVLMRRYVTALAQREARLPGTIADVSLWLETERTGPLPGAHATLGLGGHDVARLRVDAAFGTALDLAAIGDSLFAWIPSRAAVVRAAAADPPFAFAAAADFGVRVAAGTWRVPAGAWTHAVREDSLHVLRWTDAGDSLTMGLGASGLPREVRCARPGMGTLRVAYQGYVMDQGVAWPARIEVEDEAGGARLSVRVRRLARARDAGPARFRPDMPAGAEALEPGEILKWFENELSP